MRAVQVSAWGQPPTFTPSAPEPSTPTSDDKVQIKVIGSALPQLVRSQTAGTHYTTKTATMPYTPGADGVGLTPSGEMVYFNSIMSGGGFAEQIVVPKMFTYPIPVPASSSEEEKKKLGINLAGLANPAMASWMALRTRVAPAQLPENGWTLLILGGASLSGQVAIPLMRHLGATKIIGAARDATALSALGFDERVVLSSEDPSKTVYDPALLNGVDVIFDFIYGDHAAHLLHSLPSDARTARAVTYVQIGAMGGSSIPLDAVNLRTRNLTIVGSAPGSWSLAQMAKETAVMIKVMAEVIGSKDVAPLRIRKLEEVEEAYADKKVRTVFVP